MPSIRSVGIGAALVLSAALVATPLPAQAAPSSINYVALGDSWSADVFTTLLPDTQGVPLGCAQSPTNYPHQVAEALHAASFADATCGSATTANMTQPQSVPLGGTNAPQFNRLTPATNLVTLGIGGNDVGIATDVESCIGLPVDLPGMGCKAKFTKGGIDEVSEAIAATAPKIAAVIAGIKQRSPHARILLVNYLDGVPLDGRGCWGLRAPMASSDMAWFASKFEEMNAMIASVAEETHVQLVDTFTPTIGHDVCQAAGVRDIEGLIPLSTANSTLLAFPFHPNQNGANAQAQAVLAAIKN